MVQWDEQGRPPLPPRVANVRTGFRRKLLARFRGFTTSEWLLGLFILFVGITLFQTGEINKAQWYGEILKEASYVVLGTVAVTLAYDLWLRPKHDRDILELVESSVIKDGPRFGLTSIERRIDYRDIFDSLLPGDELLWLDTYCSGRDFLDPLRDALGRNASVAMLAVEPSSLSAEFRGKEMTTSQPEEFRAEVAGFIELVRREVENNESIGRDNHHVALPRPRRAPVRPGRADALAPEGSARLTDSEEDNGEDQTPKVKRTQRRKPYLEILTYSDLPCVPMYIICRKGRPVVGWTSYFLRKGSYDIPHLAWTPARDGGMLKLFMEYFEAKWATAADEVAERRQRRAIELKTQKRFTECSLNDIEFTKLVTQIFTERYDAQVATYATQGGWSPIVLSPATSKRHDVNYVIDLSAPLTDYGMQLYKVEVSFSAYRVVPDGALWVSFVRTPEALRHEFSQPNCVARELVDVPEPAWGRMIEAMKPRGEGLARPFSASLKWENEEPTSIWAFDPWKFGASETIVRLKFPKRPREALSAGEPVNLEARLTFYVSADITNFPVRFPAFFCLGHTVVNFTVRDNAIDPISLDAFVSFAGNSIESPIESIDKGDPHTVPRWIRVQTKPATVLWPGSGAVFSWKRVAGSRNDQDRLPAESTGRNVGESRLGC